AAREHGVVPLAARWQLHETDVVVAVAMTACVRGSLVEGPKAVALPLSPHVAGTPTRWTVGAIPARLLRLRTLRRIVFRGYSTAAQRELHGLQSLPEFTK